MKKYYSLLLVVMFLILAPGMFWSCKKQAKTPPQIIFVEYDAVKDSLFLSNLENGPYVHSEKHVKEVSFGDLIFWKWHGSHNNLSFVSATPKDPNMDPFDKTIAVGNNLKIYIKSDTELDTGTYKYDLNITINGDTTSFDPTLQIH